MKIKFYFFSITLCISIFLSGYFASVAFAAPFSGWIWGGSEDGTGTPGLPVLGWIDMSNVSVDASGNLSGYGWSGGGDSNEGGYGWIDFGGGNCVRDNSPGDSDIESVTGHPGVCIPVTSGKYCAQGCDDGSGNSVGITKSGNSLTGWARIVGIAEATVTGNNGGWDGWIKFDSSYKDISSNFYGWNGENTTDPPLNSTNVANGLGGMLVVPGNTLKICQDGCNSNKEHPVVANINPDEFIRLKACFNSSAKKCDDPDPAADVTAGAGWSEDPSGVVEDNGGKGEYKAKTDAAGKNTTVTATYNNGTEYKDTATIYVKCVPEPGYCDLSAQNSIKAATCRNSFFPDNCGNYVCPGSKDCVGWWERGP
jgi:hypothetical protein